MSQLEGSERFEIRHRLGSGASGAVYAAYDRHRKSTVALKVLQQVDAAAIYRFKKEFRALADLSHPNLVQLYELLLEGDHWCFTMELVDGRPFVEICRENGVLKEDLLRRALCQLADGLSALHSAGKLHCDVKPSNALMTSDGRLVLLDLGLVRDLSSPRLHDSLEENIVGTPAYMSPEQASGRAVSPATDWYAVGAMVYEALTGQLPFTGSVMQILMAKQRQSPPRPSALEPEVPEDLDTLCLALLQKEPRKRPSGRDVLRWMGAPAERTKAAGRADRTAASVASPPSSAEDASSRPSRTRCGRVPRGAPWRCWSTAAPGWAKPPWCCASWTT